ncbi:MAG: dihydroneopterin aldolase [Actinomycetota bacterium]|nr:dihydroneopterin aldolase [Actinomycetota bacterium]
MSVEVEVVGLRVPGRHGVKEEERERDRDFVYDLSFDVPDAALGDDLAETVDYREVAACVREVSDSREYRLIEALAGAVAEALVARFSLARVRVHVRKPSVRPSGLEVDYCAATVERLRETDSR